MIVEDDKGFCRGLNVRNGEWAYGGYSYNIPHARGFITNVGIDNQGPICWSQEVDPKTVGRFTGQYDATKWEDLSPLEQENFFKDQWCGWPIFEGDILEAHYDEKHPEDATHTVVVWGVVNPNDSCIGFGMKQDNYEPDPFCPEDAKRNKVIGNIHKGGRI